MSGSELRSLVILIVIVSLIFLIFYGITLLVNKDESEKDAADILQETIQYDEVLIGQVLNRDKKTYYVLIENANNNYNDLYLAYLNNYVSSNTNEKYYTVDLSSAFNLAYVGDVTTVYKDDFFNSKFADTTLIKVKNKKINKVYTTHDEIINLLKTLAA